ncbi:MAG: GTP-binding protein [Cytophagales bacterium]|nr:GTP-binding protein [Cytophagales bacterium]
MDLLRFTTAGSVDDGKSTLIGRLLYDTKSIFEDQLQAIEESSRHRGKEYVDLSLLTDGLRDERAQGITIDVAYRYFATPKRKFIIADTPGHIQYTRNMVTGASTAHLAIILIDARKGVIEQTYRHSIIASLLNIQHVVVCVNKMDLVQYSQDVFENIKLQYLEFSKKLQINNLIFIPISALLGDNVVDHTANMPWYSEHTLLETLETVQIAQASDSEDLRFPIQYIIRPHSTEYHDYRGYAGRIESGTVKVNDSVVAMHTGLTSKVKTINYGQVALKEATAGMSVSITLQDEIDISRGDMICKSAHSPAATQEITVMMCWLNEKKLTPNAKYLLRHTSRQTKCMVKNIDYKLNISTMEHIADDNYLNMNDIGQVKIKCATPIFPDIYRQNRTTGSIILIDEYTNETMGAGMII